MIYNSIINQIKIYGQQIYPLFNNTQIINIFYNELIDESCKDLILEILFYLFKDINFDSQKTIDLKKLFMLLPNFTQNFKFSSLQNKFESCLSFSEILMKYLKLLFSKNENLRYNAIKFFNDESKYSFMSDSQDHDRSSNKNNFLSMEFSSEENLKKNYAAFKEMDSLLLIETARTETKRILREISDEKNILLSNTIEFLPLLNILISSKIDYNIKTSAVNQIILMVKNINFLKKIILIYFMIFLKSKNLGFQGA